jgi:hypothetical protein
MQPLRFFGPFQPSALTTSRVVASARGAGWRCRSLVALPLMRDLLFSAKDLFIAAMMAVFGIAR